MKFIEHYSASHQRTYLINLSQITYVKAAENASDPNILIYFSGNNTDKGTPAPLMFGGEEAARVLAQLREAAQEGKQ